MTLSTDASYLRATTATEPPPVADAFDTGLAEIRFERFRVHNHGN